MADADPCGTTIMQTAPEPGMHEAAAAAAATGGVGRLCHTAPQVTGVGPSFNSYETANSSLPQDISSHGATPVPAAHVHPSGHTGGSPAQEPRAALSPSTPNGSTPRHFQSATLPVGGVSGHSRMHERHAQENVGSGQGPAGTGSGMQTTHASAQEARIAWHAAHASQPLTRPTDSPAGQEKSGAGGGSAPLLLKSMEDSK